MQKPETDGFAVRRLAAQILSDVLRNKQPLDTALATRISNSKKSTLLQRDRAFLRAIVSTTLRRKGQIDDLLSRFLTKGLPKKSGFLHEILLSASAQLVFLKIPAHAVIDLAVRLCKSDRGARPFAKLANAVLRRVSEHGEAIVAAQDAALLNTPDWLLKRWKNAYGEDVARQIAEAHLLEAPLDLTLKSETEAYIKALGGLELFQGRARLVYKGRIEDIQGYEKGDWWVQDFAASLPALLLGDVKGQSVADLCAAPGGKTAQLCAAGAKVTAVDSSLFRVKRLHENLQRLKFKANVVVSDVMDWAPRDKFDAVLLDAPCSATGTIRRHPDLPFLKSHKDITELSVLQEKMLYHALDKLNDTGRLVYCSCSLEPEEGYQQIKTVLAKRGDVRLDTIHADEVFGFTDWLQEGCLRTFPFYLPYGEKKMDEGDIPKGMDGFFAARLIKN